MLSEIISNFYEERMVLCMKNINFINDKREGFSFFMMVEVDKNRLHRVFKRIEISEYNQSSESVSFPGQKQF